MFLRKYPVFLFAAFSIFFFGIPLHAQESEPGSETLAAPIEAPTDSGAYYSLNRLPASLRASRPFAREFYEYIRRAGTSGTIDQGEYLRTFEEARRDLYANQGTHHSDSPQAIQGQWMNIGLISSGDSVLSAGITTAIVFDPQRPNIMYAGGSGGGVWKSLDTGNTWFPLTDDVLPNLSVASIAVDPVNTNTIYVGTGYGYSANVNYGGTGLYKSEDGGLSFERLNVNNDSGSFVKVFVDPAHDNIILASKFGSPLDLYRSTDSGQTWKSVLSGGVVWDIIGTHNGDGSSTLYCINGGDPSFGGSGNGGVWKSTDDGAHWTRVTTSTNFFAATTIGRAALATPLNAPNKIFALMTDVSSSSQAHLYESTDSGATWNVYNPGPPTDLFQVGSSISFNPQGWYDLYLAVTPNSVTNDTIYLGGVSAYVLMNGAWQYFSDYNHPGGGGGYPHVDHHSFAINPTNSRIIYDGDDGGLWVNYKAGSNDLSTGGGWRYHSTNFVSNRFYHLTFNSTNSKDTWAGAQDEGLWELPLGKPATKHSPVGDGMQPLVSPQNQNVKYSEEVQGYLFRTTQTTESWSAIADSAVGVTDAPSWDCPLKMSPVRHGSTPGSQILYFGRQHLWRSTDGGTSWTRLAPSFGIDGNGVYRTSAIGLAAWNSNLIYVAGISNIFQRSTDYGSTWTSLNGKLPGIVTSINTSWQDTNFVLVSLQNSKNKVMFSDDKGATWTDVSGPKGGASIPGADSNTICNVMSIALDSTAPLTTWYAATDFGMYETTNAGQTWSSMQLGLFPCRDIQTAPNGQLLRVATHGRGIWEYSVPAGGVELTSLSATKTSSGAQLSWYVDGEPHGATFYVQRSIDGASFENIGTVAGIGASVGRHDYSFGDNSSVPGTYIYQVHEVNADGSQIYTNHVELHFGAAGLSVYEPYPNPYAMSKETGIALSFELPARDNVLLRIYNANGTLLRTLADRPMEGGPQSITWDARDAAGNRVAPGAYFYTLETANSGSVTNKIMIVGE